MFQLERRGQVNIEDLMSELEVMEHRILDQDAAMAMDLMVLETKIRERFKMVENRIWDSYSNLSTDDVFGSDLSPEDLIPRDIKNLPVLHLAPSKKSLKTFGVAGLLAVLTAAGVFTLASLLQIALSWMA